MAKILKTVERATEYGTMEIPLAQMRCDDGSRRTLHMRINIENLESLAEMVDTDSPHFGCGRTFGKGAIEVFFAAERKKRTKG